MPKQPARVVVIGGSAGAVEALPKLVSCLPRELNAAVLAVVHVWAKADSYMPEILNRASALEAVHPRDGDVLEPRRIYVAPPDRHLLVEDGRVRVLRGPKENWHRPSIDVLFRSAATEYRGRAIGVLLTGADDDGAAGLALIKQRGGRTIIQDPHDALFSRMPASALNYIKPDYSLPLSQIGPAIARLAAEPVGETAMKESPGADPEKEIFGNIDESSNGAPSSFTCPECGGALWEEDVGGQLRYRCRIGHSYSPESMLDAESDMVERALWTAVRVLEESAHVNRRIAARAGVMGNDFLDRAEERQRCSEIIKSLLMNGGK